MNKSFTIIEVIISITILTIGVLGSVRLMHYFYAYNSIANSRLAAAYLAQEGIEIVKNIRDGNWLEGSAWNTSLGESRYEGDYNSTNVLDNYTNGYLAIDGSGLYATSSTLDVFQREIQICTSTDDVIYVSSTVSWVEAGKNYSVKTEGELCNWYQ